MLQLNGWEMGWSARGAASCDLDVWHWDEAKRCFVRWADQARWFDRATLEPPGPIVVRVLGGDPNKD